LHQFYYLIRIIRVKILFSYRKIISIFLDYVYHRTPLSSTVNELYQKIIDSLKDYLKQQHEDSSVYLQLLDRLNDARVIAHNLRKRLSLYRHTTGLTNSMNTLLDLVYVGFMRNE
jgi:hypothetical protein